MAPRSLLPYQDPNYLAIFGVQQITAFSDDLKTGMLRSFEPPVTSDAPHQMVNVFKVDLSGDVSTYRFISPPETPRAPTRIGGPATSFAGASKDWSTIVFDSLYALTDDVADPTNDFAARVYEWSNGTLRLVSVLPDGTPAQPGPIGNDATTGANMSSVRDLQPGAVSDNGSTIFFTASPGRAVGGEADGDLYVRRNGTTTTFVSRSQRATPDPAGHQPATLETATPDGRFAFLPFWREANGRRDGHGIPS